MIKNFYYSLVFVIIVGLIILASLGKNDCLCDGTLRVLISVFLCVMSSVLLLFSFFFHKNDINKIKSENNNLTNEKNDNLLKYKGLQKEKDNLQKEKDNLQKEKELTLNRLEVFYNQKMKKEKDKEKDFSKLYKEYQEFAKLFADKKDSNPTESK